MKSIKLYEISDEFNALDKLFEESGGEITETHEELLTHIEKLLATKVDNICYYVEEKNDMIELAKLKIERLKKFISLIESGQEKMESYVIECMNRMNKDKVIGDLHKISLPRKRKCCVIEDEEKIPVQFLETKVSVKKAEVKKALESGLEVDGAKLVDGKQSIKFGFKNQKGE